MSEELVPSQQPAVKSKKSLRYFFILFIVVVLLALAVAGFFVFKQLTPKSTPPVVEPIVVDPLASWQSYNNQEVGFSLKYPPIFHEVQEPSIEVPSFFNGPFVEENILQSIHIAENDGPLLQSFYFLVFDKQLTEQTSVNLVDPNTQPLGSLGQEVSGVDMYIQENLHLDGDPCLYSRAFIAANNRTILVGYRDCQDNLDSNAEDTSLFRSVLETFKYDSNKNPTFGWTEWNNSGVGLSFSFPKDYTVVSSGVYS